MASMFFRWQFAGALRELLIGKLRLETDMKVFVVLGLLVSYSAFAATNEILPEPRQVKGAKERVQDPSVDTRPVKAMDLSKQQSRVWKQQLVNNTRSGIQFLNQNKATPGVKTLKSGVQITIFSKGDGPKPNKADETVKVKLTGKLIDGTVFTTSAANGAEASTLKLADTVPGLKRAFKLMKQGSHWQVVVPADQGFGDAGMPPAVGPAAVLIFDVELVEVQPRPEGVPATSEADKDEKDVQ